MMMKHKLELLAPAGDLEKLKVAVTYGADAVYMGGQKLGLRMKARNFDAAQMEEGIAFAHRHGAKVYITANVFAHNTDFEGMADYFYALEQIGVDALIISDPGVFSVAREAVPQMDIHISTQANNTNFKSALFWHGLGAKRVVLARELSLEAVSEIHRHTNGKIELESFVHGAMCISYSGRCLLSSYMTGRDANQGECAQPCRWSYRLEESKRPGVFFPIIEDTRGTYIMNSKDLCMIGYLPELIAAGVRSFKIEGRMKTPYYVGCTVRAYRKALDELAQSKELYQQNIPLYLDMAAQCSHRKFTAGGYFGGHWADAQEYGDASYSQSHAFLGMVQSYDETTATAVIEQRGKFSIGETVEFICANGSGFAQPITDLRDMDGNEVQSAPHPMQLLQLRVDNPLAPLDMLCKRTEETE